MRLYDKDKQTLIAEITDTINMINQTDEVFGIDSFEFRNYEKYGVQTHLTTEFAASKVQTHECYWVKFDTDKYYYYSMVIVFQDGGIAANYIVGGLLGRT